MTDANQRLNELVGLLSIIAEDLKKENFSGEDRLILKNIQREAKVEYAKLRWQMIKGENVEAPEPERAPPTYYGSKEEEIEQ